MRTMAAKGANRRWRGVFLSTLAVALAGCAGLPDVGGRPLPPEPPQAGPVVYRDLADIPEAPSITPADANEAAIQMLAAERATTAVAAEDLRRQPFAPPEPAPPLPPEFEDHAN